MQCSHHHMLAPSEILLAIASFQVPDTAFLCITLSVASRPPAVGLGLALQLNFRVPAELSGHASSTEDLFCFHF